MRRLQVQQHSAATPGPGSFQSSELPAPQNGRPSASSLSSSASASNAAGPSGADDAQPPASRQHEQGAIFKKKTRMWPLCGANEVAKAKKAKSAASVKVGC